VVARHTDRIWQHEEQATFSGNETEKVKIANYGNEKTQCEADMG